MSVINVIAAAHCGQCFAHLAARLQMDEDTVARGTVALVRVILPLLEREIATRDGMVRFLNRLEAGRFAPILDNVQSFSDSDLRMRGRELAQQILSSGAVSRAALETALDESQLSPDQLAILLPHTMVLTMAAIERRLERPLREISERSAVGVRSGTSASSTAIVANMIAEGEDLAASEPKTSAARRFGNLFTRAVASP